MSQTLLFAVRCVLAVCATVCLIQFVRGAPAPPDCTLNCSDTLSSNFCANSTGLAFELPDCQLCANINTTDVGLCVIRGSWSTTCSPDLLVPEITQWNVMNTAVCACGAASNPKWVEASTDIEDFTFPQTIDRKTCPHALVQPVPPGGWGGGGGG